MTTILEEIIQQKKKTIALQKEAVSIEQLETAIDDTFIKDYSFEHALLNSPHGIIAEFKRASPSKGIIHPKANVNSIVETYAQQGAAALSILTDEPYFKGKFADLITARKCVDLPLLRKDFIVDDYQIYQSKAMGANAILLIASALTQTQCKQLAQKAQNLNLEVLLEIHGLNELDYINDFVTIVGVNNRNLKTFQTDTQLSIDLAQYLPSHLTKISESGISSVTTFLKLKTAGYNGFLMGETFMKYQDPGKALATFIQETSLK
jgi:indole-3-glycerol phosphate synthase